MRRGAGALLLLGVVLGAPGCGLGAGGETGGVSVRVTRGFGAQTLGAASRPKARASDTQLRLLERSFRVTTRYGGGFVQSIAGMAGGTHGDERSDWFYYVNGREAPKGAAGTKVFPGDHVLWDLHVWNATPHIPAIVGQFPEPFRHGTAGRRPPFRLECADDATAACDLAGRRLRSAGLFPGRSVLGASAGRDTARILVGRWTDVRGDRAASQLGEGPGGSGIYARPADGGAAIDLLDARGRRVRRLGPGSGLVAATAFAEQQPTWLVLGTDLAGVGAAAGALTPRALARAFAVAVTPSGRVLPLPVATR